MKIKKTLTFKEAWNSLNGDVLNEDVKTSHLYRLQDDPDYVNNDQSLSFKDTLLKLRDNYLNAKTDDEQDAAMDLLAKRLKSFLNGNNWKIILKDDLKLADSFTVVTGSDFAVDVVFIVLEPDVEIEFASLLADDDI